MFRSILIPLDGSAFSESALLWARALGEDASLHLASVHEPIPTFAYDEWETAASEWTEEYIREVRDRVAGQSEGAVDAWVGRGPVVDRLLERADEVGADLVVMATHGRGGLTRAWLGSVADAFLRRSSRPILLVRPTEAGGPSTATERPTPTVDRIMVPLDGSDLSLSVLEMAAQLAERWGATLHLVRIVAYPVEIASPYLPHTVQMNQQVIEQARAAAEEYLESRADELRTRGLAVESLTVVDTQAAHALAREAERLAVDMIVMATHGHGGLKRALLGSTTDKVVRSVQVPVLVARPG